MEEHLIQLLYPHDLLNTPVINNLIQRFPELGVNINQAKITSEEGMIELQLVGLETMIESAIAWLKETGMEIKHIGK